MKIEYPFKITLYNNLILVDLPKTPEKYLNKRYFFEASNGIVFHSSRWTCFINGEMWIRGARDNNRTDTYVIWCSTAIDANERANQIHIALDELVAWMNGQEKED